jgi:hypothetical protein
MSPSDADKWVFRVFAACFVASLFTGCATFENGSAYGDVFNQVRSKSYDAPLNLKAGTKTVTLWLHTPEEVKRICGGRTVMACAIPQLDGSWVVATVPPKSWNDHIALATIGHELGHIFGGRHE